MTNQQIIRIKEALLRLRGTLGGTGCFLELDNLMREDIDALLRYIDKELKPTHEEGGDKSIQGVTPSASCD